MSMPCAEPAVHAAAAAYSVAVNDDIKKSSNLSLRMFINVKGDDVRTWLQSQSDLVFFYEAVDNEFTALYLHLRMGGFKTVFEIDTEDWGSLSNQAFGPWKIQRLQLEPEEKSFASYIEDILFQCKPCPPAADTAHIAGLLDAYELGDTEWRNLVELGVPQYFIVLVRCLRELVLNSDADGGQRYNLPCFCYTHHIDSLWYFPCMDYPKEASSSS